MQAEKIDNTRWRERQLRRTQIICDNPPKQSAMWRGGRPSRDQSRGRRGFPSRSGVPNGRPMGPFGRVSIPVGSTVFPGTQPALSVRAARQLPLHGRCCLAAAGTQLPTAAPWRMVRVAGLRRALAACVQSATALQQGAAGSCRPSSLSSLVDSAPSTSYSALQPGWLRRPASAAAAAATGGQAQLSRAAAAISEEQHPQAATYTVVVVTGDVRGAGSPAPAVVTLVGTGAAASLAHSFLQSLSRG